MTNNILAVLFDCGDTLIDEGTEVHDPNNVVLQADLIPGADELLREIKQRGYRLGLVADGKASSFKNILSGHDLLDLFEVHAISELVGVSKPHPSMFRTALDGLGIQPDDYGRVIMVGNFLERDVKGANALGLISVWIDWAPRRPKSPKDPSEQPRYTIRLPLELLPILEALEQAPR
jgi:putative hydrolase of the HAD superfamily